MTRYDFDWVDAFSDRAFGGNGCAVVHGGGHLPEEVACAYVRETSLSECTFTAPSEIADIKVRYFLAGQEIPFAGHPTIATVAALRDRGLIAAGRITLETGAGLVPVDVSGGLIVMQQIAPTFGPMAPIDLVAKTLSLPVDAIIAPPQQVSTGLPFVITPLRDHAAMKAAELNVDALHALADAVGCEPGSAEPFMVVQEGFTPAGDTSARLLLAPPNPAEDPFTGSATGAMAAYLWAHGHLEKPDFAAEQGHLMGRPGIAQVSCLGPRDAMTGVKVGGKGFVLMRGTVELPDSLD